MNWKATTVKNIMRIFEKNMVIIKDIELYNKQSHNITRTLPSEFISDIGFLNQSGIFKEAFDFEYEYIYDREIIRNDGIKISCGYKNYFFPYCITINLELNKDECNSLKDLATVLSETNF